MILCHEWRFIFLKTPKTAGTSLEFALSALCGPDDILTPTGPIEEEYLRLGCGAQNYIRGRPDLPRKTREDGVVMPNNHVDFFNHMPADKAKAAIDEDIWNGYFKFAFTRNPWDREVSRYLFDKRHHNVTGDMNFHDYFLSLEKPRGQSWRILSIDGEVAVDFVGRYERIEEDFRTALEKVGWTKPLEIPRAKGKFRQKEERDYRPFFDEETNARIMQWYGPEIAAFNYSFDDFGK
jgi:hypothetical protein